MTKKEQYIAIKKYLALITSSYGEKVWGKIPFADKGCVETLNEAQEDMFIEAIKKPEFAHLRETQLEFQRLKDILPSTSIDSIKVINDRLSQISLETQSELDFDAQLYFELYFLLNGEMHKTYNSKPIVQSADLINAFNDWFVGSMVNNAAGKPKVVYHGTGREEFQRFSFDLFPGMYFAENRSYSEWFAKARGTEGIVFECHLRVLNPIDLRLFKTDKVTYEEFTGYMHLKYGYELPMNRAMKAQSDAEGGIWAWRYLRFSPDWLKHIIQTGEFDGIAFYENNPDDRLPNGEENITAAWMVFKPEQIKAAHGNLTYSFNSKDIRFKTGGEL